MNVFVVLTIGILLARWREPRFCWELRGMTDYAQDIYAGFGNMQEIFLLSMLIGGLSELIVSRWI